MKNKVLKLEQKNGEDLTIPVPLANKVVIEVSGSAKFKVLFINDKAVLKGNGSYSAVLEAGEHYVAWVIRGKEGQTYTVKIVEPKEAKDEITQTLDDEGRDAGVVRVKIN
uniref:hypothetical protein n=1 Tax=Roseivirga sp. TaxID=1964215 RepID=UPI004047BD0E